MCAEGAHAECAGVCAESAHAEARLVVTWQKLFTVSPLRIMMNSGGMNTSLTKKKEEREEKKGGKEGNRVRGEELTPLSVMLRRRPTPACLAGSKVGRRTVTLTDTLHTPHSPVSSSERKEAQRKHESR
eukprot:703314-Rhodomonas_salina.1